GLRSKLRAARSEQPVLTLAAMHGTVSNPHRQSSRSLEAPAQRICHSEESWPELAAPHLFDF
ncbi:hypothetical protein, partial [Stutzerimonas stutzeri]|uniref:hypothetical protein n=1 Tax=Stutzerimonas stutzeri TaxID=316 RepID=UPI0019554072